MFYSFSIFQDAVNNEIRVDENLLSRLDRNDLTFIPLRALKTLKYIDRYHISSSIYALFGLMFVLASPIYFLLKMLKAIFLRKYYSSSEIIDKKNLVLVANGRVEHLFKKLNFEENIQFLNINQAHRQKLCHVYRYLSFKNYLSAYVHAICSVPYILFNLKDKKDILQCYVAYEWFLVYIALLKIKSGVETVYFANHYDRWAVMFDQLFANKNIILLQHGIVSESINLSYKLQHIKQIYSFNELSIAIFKIIFDCKNTQFDLLNISLVLSDIKSDKKTILIAGQPHSVHQEIDIIKRLQLINEFDIYVKPHPLFDDSIYKQTKGIKLINTRQYYPKVDIVLCYESTLGLEYEASGVNVLWWKQMGINDIINNIRKDKNV